MFFFATRVYLRGNLPVRLATQRKFNESSTCAHLRLLAGPIDQGLKMPYHGLKPWPNGLASRRKLRTWVYLRLRLARACVHLH